MRKTMTGVAWTVASFALLVIIWALYVNIFNVEHFILPPPGDVAAELVNQLATGQILSQIAVTTGETVIGFVAGVVAGMTIGYLVAHSEAVKLTLMPFLIFFQVAPKIALVPIFIIWFGLGIFSKLFVVFSMVFFPIALGMIDGLNSIPSDMRDLMKVLRASRSQTFFKLELRHAAPQLFAACKVGIVQALIGATVAEWMSGQSGLGYVQTNASSTFNTPLLMVGIILTIVLGIVLYYVIVLIEKRVCFWEGEQQ